MAALRASVRCATAMELEAIRLRARRLAVIRRAKVIAETAPDVAMLSLPGRPAQVDPASYAPQPP